MKITLTKNRDGEITKVRGDFNQVCEGLKERGADLKKSRTGNGNLNIWLKGFNVGQVITPDSHKTPEELKETINQRRINYAAAIARGAAKK